MAWQFSCLACTSLLVLAAVGVRVDDGDDAAPIRYHHRRDSGPGGLVTVEEKAQNGRQEAKSALVDAQVGANILGFVVPTVPPAEIAVVKESDATIKFLDEEAREEAKQQIGIAESAAKATRAEAQTAKEKEKLAHNETVKAAVGESLAKSRFDFADQDHEWQDEKTQNAESVKLGTDAFAFSARIGLKSAQGAKQVEDAAFQKAAEVAKQATDDAEVMTKKLEQTFSLEANKRAREEDSNFKNEEAKAAFKDASMRYDMAYSTQNQLAPIMTGTKIVQAKCNENLAVAADKEMALLAQVKHGITVTDEEVKAHLMDSRAASGKREKDRADKASAAKDAEIKKKRVGAMKAAGEEKKKADKEKSENAAAAAQFAAAAQASQSGTPALSEGDISSPEAAQQQQQQQQDEEEQQPVQEAQQ